MAEALKVSSVLKRELILDAALLVFGRFGFRKTSVEELADAAQISKQGLYLHFASKEEIFVAAILKYLDDGLILVQQALDRPDAALLPRLLEAMDAWFGRHLATFTPASFDVLEASNRLANKPQGKYSLGAIESYKRAFRDKLSRALAASPEFKRSKNVCTAPEIAQTLFQLGLTWKEGHASRADYLATLSVGIRACCQIKEGRVAQPVVGI